MARWGARRLLLVQPTLVRLFNGLGTLLGVVSVEVGEGTAAVVQDQARRARLTVDEYIRRLLLHDSLAQHASVIDERYYLDAEAERLAS